jgi:hypothetical protein
MSGRKNEIPDKSGMTKKGNSIPLTSLQTPEDLLSHYFHRAESKKIGLSN